VTSTYGMTSTHIEHRIALLPTAAMFDQLLAEPDRDGWPAPLKPPGRTAVQ
jgi:hypothetical protein